MRKTIPISKIASLYKQCGAMINNCKTIKTEISNRPPQNKLNNRFLSGNELNVTFSDKTIQP